MSHKDTAIRTSLFSLAGNAALAVIKALAGIFGNSFALIADAIESATDIIASLLLFFGLQYANRPADANHPYGHGRLEPLITFVVVGFLILSATFIAVEAIRNIGSPQEMPSSWTLYVLGGIIIWKEISYRVVNRKSRETKSSSLKADAWHHRSDAITSLAAFAGIGMALVLGPGYESLDDWAALVAAGFILYNSYQIFRPALGEIMDEHLHEEMIEEIRKVSHSVEGIRDTEKCYIRKTGMTYHVDLHAIVDGDLSVRKGHELAHRLQDRLREEFPELGQVLIHIEPG